LKSKEVFDQTDFSTKVTMVQTLLPLGLQAFQEMIASEVEELIGAKSKPGKNGVYRWGNASGWIYLADQKVKSPIPRVRDTKRKAEMELKTYQAFQNPRIADNQVLKRVMMGLLQRRYEEAALTIPEAFGIAPSSVSRTFIRATSRRLEEMMNRDLSIYDIVAIVMDGKYFAEADMIVAVGITMTGEKVVLGFVESGSENHKVIKDFLYGLIDRGLKKDREILFVTDGSKGLHKGIEMVFGSKGIIQRCQWHKTENVISYLPQRRQDEVKRKMRLAYASETYEQAKRKLGALKNELRLMNQSAANSLEEGLEETLMLHRLGVFKELGISFKTTNMIESVFSQVGQFTDRVDCWKNSSQRQRWLAASLLEIEKRLRKVKGYKHLPMLRQKMESQSLQMQRLCA
jgi:transposase-like protein